MSKSFTLIELLVAMAIVVVLLAAAIPALRTFEKRGELNQAAEQIRDTILETKNYALAPRDNKPADVKFYAFAWSACDATGGVNARMYCLNEGTVPMATSYLASNINFSSNDRVNFSIAKQGAVVDNGDNFLTSGTIDIKIEHLQLHKFRHIYIEPATGKVTISNEQDN